jgi:H2-forming N5,N10-methylenetetrahydromethanopterin dehydrogenase-like enzyme
MSYTSTNFYDSIWVYIQIIKAQQEMIEEQAEILAKLLEKGEEDGER